MKRNKVDVLDRTGSIIELGEGLKINSGELVPAARAQLDKAMASAKTRGFSVIGIILALIALGWIAGLVLNLVASLFAIMALLAGTFVIGAGLLTFGPKFLQYMQIQARELEIGMIKNNGSTFIELFVLPAFAKRYEDGQGALSQFKASIDGDQQELERNFKSGRFAQDFYEEQMSAIQDERAKIPQIETAVTQVGAEVQKWNQILAQTRFLEGRANAKQEINKALTSAFGAGIEGENGEIAISGAIAKSAKATATLDTTLNQLMGSKLRTA